MQNKAQITPDLIKRTEPIQPNTFRLLRTFQDSSHIIIKADLWVAQTKNLNQKKQIWNFVIKGHNNKVLKNK